MRHRSVVLQDLQDPVAGPFTALVLIVPLILAANALFPHAATAGRITVDVLIALLVLLGGWLTGQWIYAPLSEDLRPAGYCIWEYVLLAIVAVLVDAVGGRIVVAVARRTLISPSGQSPPLAPTL